MQQELTLDSVTAAPADGDDPIRGAWDALRRAGLLASAHTPLNAGSAPAVQVWTLLTTTYRDALRDLGWDPDLLPQPPAAHEPAARAADRAPATTADSGSGPRLTVASGRDATVALHADVGHPLRDAPRDTVPGAAWDGTSQTWTVPATRRAATALRHLVITHHVRVDPDAAALLRTASADTTPDVTVVDGRIHITTAHTNALKHDLARHGATWNGTVKAWTLPVTAAAPVARAAADHDLLIDPAAARGTFPLDLLAALVTRTYAAVPAPVRPDPGDLPTRAAARTNPAAAGVDGAVLAALGTIAGTPPPTVAAANAADGLLAAVEHRAAGGPVHASAGEAFDYDGTVDGLRGVPVTELAAVAHARPTKDGTLADRLAEFGITSVLDLLHHVPARYLDRATLTPIRHLPVGENAGIVGTITATTGYDRARRLCRFTVSDGSGDISLTFFNAPWMPRRYRTGDLVTVYGRVDVWQARNGKQVRQMTNPVMDLLGDDTAKVVPVYPQSAKSRITTWDLHTAATEAVRRLGDLTDPVPVDVAARLNLMPRATAYRQVHHPDTLADAEAARTRLAFDELLRMQLALVIAKHAVEDGDIGPVHTPTGHLTGPFLDRLPFPPTDAQTRVLTEITTDLTRPYPMHRLLQGDVGAGKSVCGLAALLTAVESGHQGALMAPTEILAWQLYREAVERFDGLTTADGTPVSVAFLANKTKAKERRAVLAGLADGTIHVVVGTHALLVDDVAFASLGLVVVDEQHRFGVEQRAALRGKGVHPDTGDVRIPDMLVMTATPIPRTQAMTVYGDLDVSVLDQMPPGRTPIRTDWIRAAPVYDTALAEPWTHVLGEVADGRQAYVVCPLVEGSDKVEAESATDVYEQLSAGALSGLRVGLVHGRIPTGERDATMAAFKAGDLDVIVATTVIEVGVNVPNATVIVVLDAPRFGLAQLHQLRGRVGRGTHPSACYLVGDPGSADGVARMQVMVDTTDGFVIAERDLDIRGEGAILGAAQAGQDNGLRVASLRDDRDLVLLARREAVALTDSDRALARRPGLRSEVYSALPDDAVAWLNRS